jgi:damage-control phosphatase, subfamily I
MKTHFDCVPCIVRQSLDSARLVTDDEQIHEQILREVLEAAARMDLEQSPPVMAQTIHRRLRELTGQVDPYREAKDRFNRLALELYPKFQTHLQQADNRLEVAVRLAIAGNIIDLGVKSGLEEQEVVDSIESCLTDPLSGCVGDFAAAIADAQSILYLADNAGEIIFDRLLVEQLPRDRVVVAVRGAPVINDATMVDAETAGLTEIVPVIDNGSDAPGTVLEDCSPAFRRRFEEADLIISKGQGNYETLGELPRPIYFLLCVKCPMVARHTGCPVGRMLLTTANNGQESAISSTPRPIPSPAP